MKHIIISALTLIIASTSFAQPIDSVKTNGNWSNASTWSLNRVPQNGDDVVIPVGKVLTVDNNLTVSGAIDLNIFGTLNLAVGKLNLGNGSTVALKSSVASIVTGQGNNSDRISINGILKYSGVEGVKFGPSIATSNSSASPMGFASSASTVLPVKFESFTAVAAGKAAKINWSTSEEVNADLYVIEKSADGRNFAQVGKVKANGKADLNNYSFNDELTQSSYYRIRQVDKNGKATFTGVIFVKSALSTQTQISANNGTATVRFASSNNNVQISIINMNGQVLKTVQANGSTGVAVVNTNLKGAHLITVQMQDGSSVASQVIL